jgi:hypothetical protein
MEYFRKILDNQDARTQKTKVFEKQVMKIINNEDVKSDIIKDISNKYIDVNKESNLLNEDKEIKIDEINKIISESFLAEFKLYGQDIQALNTELRNLIQEIENYKSNTELNCENNDKLNKENILKLCKELVDFINNILMLEKTNFETLIKMLQNSLKIGQMTNIYLSSNKSSEEKNKIKEELKILDIESNIIYKNLINVRENISDFITEKKYVINSLNENK